jgi:hypothetical protein
VSTHQRRKLLADTLQQTQTVVLSEGHEEVLDDIALVAGDLLELLDDQGLVGASEGGSGDETGQPAVGLEGLAEAGEGLSGLLEVGGLGGGSELFIAIQLVMKFQLDLVMVWVSVFLVGVQFQLLSIERT